MHKYRSLLRENKIDEIKEFIEEIDFIENFDLLFEYFIIACDYENYDLIDYFVEEFNFDVNQENSKCENVLFRLSDLDKNCDVMRYLIEEHLNDICPFNTIYHPIFNCFAEKFCKNNFHMFMENEDIIDFKILDQTNKTILYSLIPYNEIDTIKTLCLAFIDKYGFTEFRQWVSHNDCISLCIDCGFNYIAKYLLYLTLEVPDKIFLTKKGKFEIKLIDENLIIPTRSSDLRITQLNPSFNEFYIIYSKLTCILWDPIELNDIREIYNIADDFSFNEIYKAIKKCVVNDHRIDFDSVKLFLTKAKEEYYAQTIQVIYKYNNNKRITPIKKINAKIIQKSWRRRKYLRNSKEKCNICLDYLITKSCKLLDCKHIFHSKCISNWRIVQNKCPSCRNIILKPTINL